MKNPAEAGFFTSGKCSSSLDIGSLLTLGAGRNFEGDALAFLQGFEARHVDCGEMSEEIVAAFVRSNETEAFGIIEPLNST